MKENTRPNTSKTTPSVRSGETTEADYIQAYVRIKPLLDLSTPPPPTTVIGKPAEPGRGPSVRAMPRDPDHVVQNCLNLGENWEFRTTL